MKIEDILIFYPLLFKDFFHLTMEVHKELGWRKEFVNKPILLPPPPKILKVPKLTLNTM